MDNGPEVAQAHQEPIITARDLVKEYETEGSVIRALDGVTMEVPRGHFVVVMGPSGSGKSTLLHLLGGLDTPTSGQIFLEGTRLSHLSDRQLSTERRRKIGFVFQFDSLVPVLTAEENIALPAIIDRQQPSHYQARLDKLLEFVGLSHRRRHVPSMLSGGEQQRVTIARALLMEPLVVLADEPTGNLDSRNGIEILTFVKNAQLVMGQTIVLVTHDPKVAAFGDEILYLSDGRIIDQLCLTKDAKRSTTPGQFEKGAREILRWLHTLGA